MKTNQRLQELLQRHWSETASPDEQEELWTYVNDPAYHEIIRGQIGNEFETPGAEPGLSPRQEEQILQSILKNDQIQQQPNRLKLWPRVAAAAAIILITSAGLFFYQRNNKTDQTTQLAKNDIAPGGNKAFLTLANGKRISLTDAANGAIAKQAGVSITKTANGQLIYSISNSIHNNSEELQYNTVETPKGGQYQLTLPDGTNVWLNAASSLKYPASFASLKERKVQLTGEGYFEVAKDKAHPFIVETNKQEVEVLGTHFNINSYADEPSTKTTLLEGSVRLNSNTNLKPGEQATLVAGQISITEANVNKAVAWKNGKFVFDDEGIESIMRKLSRWYNVEVVYEGDFSDRTFTGSISRYDNISKILDKITYIQAVHFKIEGRRIHVMK